MQIYMSLCLKNCKDNQHCISFSLNNSLSFFSSWEIQVKLMITPKTKEIIIADKDDIKKATPTKKVSMPK